MNTPPRMLAAGLLLFSLTAAAVPAVAQEPITPPEEGDPVIVYTHKFKPAEFEAGKKLVIEGFSDAIVDHGHDRLTFFMVDEHATEVVVVSVFPDEATMKDWQAAGVRHEVLEKLEPMRRQPLIFQTFTLESLHTTMDNGQ